MLQKVNRLLTILMFSLIGVSSATAFTPVRTAAPVPVCTRCIPRRGTRSS